MSYIRYESDIRFRYGDTGRIMVFKDGDVTLDVDVPSDGEDSGAFIFIDDINELKRVIDGAAEAWNKLKGEPVNEDQG